MAYENDEQNETTSIGRRGMINNNLGRTLAPEEGLLYC